MAFLEQPGCNNPCVLSHFKIFYITAKSNKTVSDIESSIAPIRLILIKCSVLKCALIYPSYAVGEIDFLKTCAVRKRSVINTYCTSSYRYRFKRGAVCENSSYLRCAVRNHHTLDFCAIGKRAISKICEALRNYNMLRTVKLR